MKNFREWILKFENEDFDVFELRIIRNSVNHRLDKLNNDTIRKIQEYEELSD